ncbi:MULTISPECIES: nucleoside phosphorylase [Anaerolinea]|uniref:nucleoside phosphorylase n=1 Tax=Anaerolinea TaxID=233189 RepID=UPI00261BB0A0|nr:nucleoside phosphorylase [Anaerolinea thermophila]
MEQPYPILEFDPDPTAILNPHCPSCEAVQSTRAVLCFFADILKESVERGELRVIGMLGSEIGENPIYLHETPTRPPVIVIHPGVGAPLAAGFLEEILSMGVEKVIVYGGCGVLKPEIRVGDALIPVEAVRDEGTSYHYLPPSRSVSASLQAVQALEQVCRAMGVHYRTTKTWTTDAFYRETPAKRARRLAEGCEIVEMEAAALFAVARFRKVTLGQIVYGGDLVLPEGWDSRAWNSRRGARRLLYEIALEAVRQC